ncbi:hypothetical protein ACFWCA_44870 [Streptomyces phaeochromogenes]|uniref:hypothetical protein n=1 Tax=Streptomyces phaeochromogenes TaxID=1923 RepID=UPI0036C7D2D6
MIDDLTTLFGTDVDEPFLRALASGLDHHADHVVAAESGGHHETAQHRTLASGLRSLLTAYLYPGARRYADPELLDGAMSLFKRLDGRLGDDGLFGGDNLASPPDSSFTVSDVCVTTTLIDTLAVPDDPGLARLRRSLAAIRRAVTPALLTGGVHTPNHRWELCAALARLHRLDPDPRLPARIDQWLAEGIDIQPDGMYSERSPLYAAHVTNPSLLAIADALDRPALLDPVRRNLDAFAELFDEDGVVESVHSRRQDQRKAFSGSGFLLLYRRFALREGRSDYGQIVTAIMRQGLVGEMAATALAEVLIDTSLALSLPTAQSGTERESPTETFLADSGLAHLRSGRHSLTVFGGTDSPRFPVIASGLSTNPTFLRFRRGDALLTSVRLSMDFFGLGPFRSEGLRREGGRYHLARILRAGYYQPLPASRQRPHGDYELGSEGRFFAAMDFVHRPTDTLELEVAVDIEPTDRGADVRLTLEGPPTSYTLELTFPDGGILEGVRPVPGRPSTFELAEGSGTYTVGRDRITFGPGSAAGPSGGPPLFDYGEQFTYLGARDDVPGRKVFLTGRIPGAHTLHLTGDDV